MSNLDGRQFISWSAAGASVAAGLIHLAVMPEHLREWWGYGAFFALIAAFQLAWAVLVLRTQRPAVPLVGIAVNGAVLAVWALSRTVGLGLGPEGAHAHTVGLPDLVVAVAELLLIVQSARLLVPRGVLRLSRPGPARWVAVVLAVAGAAITTSAVVTVATASEPHHRHAPERIIEPENSQVPASPDEPDNSSDEQHHSKRPNGHEGQTHDH